MSEVLGELPVSPRFGVLGPGIIPVLDRRFRGVIGVGEFQRLMGRFGFGPANAQILLGEWSQGLIQFQPPRELRRITVNLVIRLPEEEHTVTIDVPPGIAGERAYTYPYGRRVVRYPKGSFQAQYEVNGLIDISPVTKDGQLVLGPDGKTVPKNELLRDMDPYVNDVKLAKQDFIDELDELFNQVAEHNKWTASKAEEVIMNLAGRKIRTPEPVVKVYIERNVEGEYKRYVQWQQKLNREIKPQPER